MVAISFSPASRIILIERANKDILKLSIFKCFSPASRIILIESFMPSAQAVQVAADLFQSRKQDYFNWKFSPEVVAIKKVMVSVPQAGLF